MTDRGVGAPYALTAASRTRAVRGTIPSGMAPSLVRDTPRVVEGAMPR